MKLGYIFLILGVSLVGCNGAMPQPKRNIIYIADDCDVELLDAVRNHLYTDWGTVRFETPQHQESIDKDYKAIFSRHFDIEASEIETTYAPLMVVDVAKDNDADTCVMTWTPKYYSSNKASILIHKDRVGLGGGISLVLLSRNGNVWMVTREFQITVN